MNPNLTRRRFLEHAGAAMAGVALSGPVLAETRDRSRNAKIIVGSGEHRYECLHDWLTPPDSLKFGDTQGIAEDSKGNIYIAHTVHPTSPSDDAIAVFDKRGRFVKSWGARFKGGAHGLDLRKENGREYLYHCDTAHRQVVKTDLDGNVIWEKGVPKEAGVYGEKSPFIPTNVAFSPNGDFYVTDGYGSDWIHQYDVKGNYIRTFGGKGKEPGKVLQAHGAWVDTRRSEPLLAVADRANSRIQYFSLDGKHVKFSHEGMRKPCHFHIRGDRMLVPDLSSVVTILDRENKVVAQLGDGNPTNLRGRPREEFIPGRFIHPHDAQFLRNGDILVAEWVPTGRITRLKRLG
ncbi:MAG: hypothetical protein KY468_20445 [Armatimonadetes bacterium]|nr:hypothetical protein [Armatimonadota bacterium]